ncbi:MAG TPA: DUF421 domain-containing protein [Clostridia bacterium]|nr:DUF421 domain-containing protein [Clostridia bacterium]
MIISFVRTIILFLIVITVMRIMGKRQIGELQPFELVIAIMISELAAVPMQETGIPLLSGIIPILTLLIIQLTFSYLSMKSETARQVLCGTPSIVIQNGKIVEEELYRLRYNINDLLEQLREKDYPNISDVEYAILETSGKLSVIPKSSKRPLTPSDLQLPTGQEGLPITLISDGVVNEENLAAAGVDYRWLLQQLKSRGISNPKKVLFATLNPDGQLFLQQKAKYAKKEK